MISVPHLIQHQFTIPTQRRWSSLLRADYHEAKHGKHCDDLRINLIDLIKEERTFSVQKTGVFEPYLFATNGDEDFYLMVGPLEQWSDEKYLDSVLAWIKDPDKSKHTDVTVWLYSGSDETYEQQKNGKFERRIRHMRDDSRCKLADEVFEKYLFDSAFEFVADVELACFEAKDMNTEKLQVMLSGILAGIMSGRFM